MAITFTTLDETPDANTFIQNYRDSLQGQYDASVANIEQQKVNDEASIMSNANSKGMMYSNLPQRDKIKYQTSTYLPNLVTARNTYQSGIDTLRSKAAGLANNVTTIEQAIKDLNDYNTSVYYPST